jgi:hypothetical protein
MSEYLDVNVRSFISHQYFRSQTIIPTSKVSIRLEDHDSIKSTSKFSSGAVNLEKLVTDMASQKAPTKTTPMVPSNELAIVAAAISLGL